MPWALALYTTCSSLNAPCEHVLVCLCLLYLLVNCNDFDPGKRPINKLDSSDPFKLNDPFQPFPGNDSPKEKDPDMFCDPFTSSATTNKEADPSNFANFSAYPSEEDMIEWAKRESEREEEQRLARLNQQEQEDLELAIALSKSEISEA